MAAPEIASAIFGLVPGIIDLFTPDPYQPIQTGPRPGGPQRAQLGMRQQSSGPSPLLGGALDLALAGFNYGMQPNVDSGLLSPRQHAAQQALMIPGGVSLGKPLSSLEPKGLSFMGQTPSLGRGGQGFNPTYQDYLDSQRIYGGL
jgi:hypothetical protein